MAYRGQDLDLRVPTETYGARETSLSAASIGASDRTNSYVVDDSVLSCFNRAYDIATAHRSLEVRIAHLLLATTRIPETSHALQTRGVYIPALMRETAAAVASEFPHDPAPNQPPPRVSREVEDILKYAAVYAERQRKPINADDLIDVLFELRAELPGMELLSQNLGREDKKGSSDVRDVPRERIRMPSGSSRYDRDYEYRSSISDSAADSIQNSRLDALEDMVRALGTDLANERRTFTDVISDLQRDARPRQTNEVGYERRYTEVETAPRETLTRTTATTSPAFDGEIVGRMDALMRELDGLGSRLSGLERQLSKRSVGDVDMGPLNDRLGVLEVIMRDVQKDRGSDVSEVADRIADLETLISDRGSVDVDLKPMTDRLDIIEEAVMNVDKGDSASLLSAHDSLSDRVKDLDNRIATLTTNTTQIQSRWNERMEALISDVSSQRAELLSSLTETKSLLQAEIGRDREDNSEFVAELGQVHEALMKLNTNQHTLASSIETWREKGTTEYSLMSSRLEQVVAETGKPMQMLETMSANLDAMHRLTVEKYRRRNRFWYWLFGTDDWVSASWPATTARVEAEQERVKTEGNNTWS